MAKEPEKTAPAKAAPVPLANDALVRLKRPFRVGLETYPPSRFGVVIPAGTVLPRDAIVLQKKVVPEPEVEEISAEEQAKRDAAKAAEEEKAKAEAEAKAKLKV